MDKDRFIRVYANLADDLRKEIVVIIDGQPYTWKSAYIEINNDTEKAKKILKKLVKMELI